ncbi:uncharacterized protein HD556DRAFT_1426187, partial [Suillus plorans]
MRLSLLAVVVSLTTSMFVGACTTESGYCKLSSDCCDSLICDQVGVSMSRSPCNQDPITHLLALAYMHARTDRVEIVGSPSGMSRQWVIFCFRFGIMIDGAISSWR